MMKTLAVCTGAVVFAVAIGLGITSGIVFLLSIIFPTTITFSVKTVGAGYLLWVILGNLIKKNKKNA